MDQSKIVEVKIMHATFTTDFHHDYSFLVVNFTAKFQREDRERGRRIREGYEK